MIKFNCLKMCMNVGLIILASIFTFTSLMHVSIKNKCENLQTVLKCSHRYLYIRKKHIYALRKCVHLVTRACDCQ